jgi:hypothetical protein
MGLVVRRCLDGTARHAFVDRARRQLRRLRGRGQRPDIGAPSYRRPPAISSSPSAHTFVTLRALLRHPPRILSSSSAEAEDPGSIGRRRGDRMGSSGLREGRRAERPSRRATMPGGRKDNRIPPAHAPERQINPRFRRGSARPSQNAPVGGGCCLPNAGNSQEETITRPEERDSSWPSSCSRSPSSSSPPVRSSARRQASSDAGRVGRAKIARRAAFQDPAARGRRHPPQREGFR